MRAELLRTILDHLEDLEAKLLMWGIHSVSFSEEEVIDEISLTIAQFEDYKDVDPDDVLYELIIKGLLHETDKTTRYRTRMAETVRLTALLRQWFHGQDYESSRNLVSDLRFMSRPRTIPRRNVGWESAIETLRSELKGEWDDELEHFTKPLIEDRLLSKFQLRSLVELLRNNDSDRGTIISAGTGSGKTLAFFLPVLAKIIAAPKMRETPTAIALYPRTELLRDQLGTVLSEVRDLKKKGLNAPRIGVLYASVPHDWKSLVDSKTQESWIRVESGFVCPIISCTEKECDGRLIWLEKDYQKPNLTCERCSSQISGEILAFTRQQLTANSPDILFTTTEMLNRNLGFGSLRKLFIGNNNETPEFLLLDEVHTYTGNHGAQVALLLRRWRSYIRKPLCYVGLSATLSHPTEFFSQLTGIESGSISEIEPTTDELIEFGREYLLALRGDPASQTSLLSTTIQTSMLMRRMLDKDQRYPSEGMYGSRVFVFGDDLDIVNRLHAQMEDAEGWKPGGVDMKPKGSLANLRKRGKDDYARDSVGQLWSLAEKMGNFDVTNLKISRTTSRDRGVDQKSDIVIATAALEVGYDDERVGAVIQHKAPRDHAQLIQRKGRAGRKPTMRPWTVVVLSDYGRDRISFQAYEELFNPTIEFSNLPLKNRSILKMQAVWYLLDEINKILTNIDIRKIYDQSIELKRSGPSDIDEIVSAIRNRFLSPDGIANLRSNLAKIFLIETDLVESILWDPPRGILTSFVPSLLRRLLHLEDSKVNNYSLPKGDLSLFAPPNLFSALNTPEVEIFDKFQPAKSEFEPAENALILFAPGRVNYRYAIGGKRDRRWVKPPNPNEKTLAIESFCDNYFQIGKSKAMGNLTNVIQPFEVLTEQPPKDTPDSCYGRWEWKSHFGYDSEPVELHIPHRLKWSSIFRSLEVFSHRNNSPLNVVRCANSFTVEWNDPNKPSNSTFSVTLNEMPADVGVEMIVDALRITVSLPKEVPENEELLKALRVPRLEHLIKNDETIKRFAPSIFIQEWLCLILIATIARLDPKTTVADLMYEHTDKQLAEQMKITSEKMFNSSEYSKEGGKATELSTSISQILESSECIASLRRHANTLWEKPDKNWNIWFHSKYLSTICSAFTFAIQITCPDINADNLICDFEADTNSLELGTIYICEDQPGSTGVIESMVDYYWQDPNRFWGFLEMALSPSISEAVDTNLGSLLEDKNSEDLSSFFTKIRGARNFQQQTLAWQEFREFLNEGGYSTDQSVISAISTRFVRSVGSLNGDEVIRDLLKLWRRMESSLGFEIDIRAFSIAASRDESIRNLFKPLSSLSFDSERWIANQIVGLLWSRGHKLRSLALSNYSRFRQFEPTERLIFSNLLEDQSSRVEIDSDTWRENLDSVLAKNGNATLVAKGRQIAKDALVDLLVSPSIYEVIEYFPKIVGFRRNHGEFEIHLVVDEMN